MTIRRIESSGCVIYMTEAEYQLKRMIEEIGWKTYSEQFQPKPPKERAQFLQRMGFDRRTIATCLGISRARLWEIMQRTPEQKARRNEYSRRWMKEHYQPRVRDGLKPSEVADIVGVSSGLVRLWIRDGKLPAENVSAGKAPRYRVRQDDLDRFLNEAIRRKSKPQNGS